MYILMSMIKRIYWFDDALQEALKANGIEPLSRAQIFVVANIVGGESRASKIARNLGVSRQAISQILAELSRRSMINVVEDPSNKRSRIVTFSPTFFEDGQLCTQIFAKLEEELGRRIGSRRLNSLRDTLDFPWGDTPHLGRIEEASEGYATGAVRRRRRGARSKRLETTRRSVSTSPRKNK